MVSTQRPGTSVIEVMVALGLASILIFSVGNLVAATSRLNTASNAQEHASLLAQSHLEQMVSFANDPTTASTVFSVSNDGTKKYVLNTSNSPWTMDEVVSPPAATWFTITADPADSNVQTIVSYAQWVNDSDNTEQMTTILTDWKNLVP